MTFDFALQRAGVPKYEGREHWLVKTELQTIPAGRFHGPLIATMRWMTPAQAIIATQVTARFYMNHARLFTSVIPALLVPMCKSITGRADQ